MELTLRRSGKLMEATLTIGQRCRAPSNGTPSRSRSASDPLTPAGDASRSNWRRQANWPTQL
jgi:hypothetical protein